MAQAAEVSFRLRRPGPLTMTVAFLGKWPVLPGVILAGMAFMAIFAPFIAPHPPLKANLKERNVPPVWYDQGSWNHVLGADVIGRDVLSRLIHGTRVSLMVVAVSMVSGTLVGTTLGLLSGYFGGLTDEVITRIVDMWMGIPFILLAMVIAVVVGASLKTMMILLALAAWTPFVRQVRAQVLSLKTRDYVSLARVAGASDLRILLRHILPEVMGLIMVIASLHVGGLILTEAFLSFLGAGIPPPTPTWGVMIAEGREYLRDAWWISFFPGVAICLTVTSLNFLGDWVRDYLDPRLRQL
ncbi:MAG: ABC transporter permease [Chloroflexota bacterium]|nr:ABC transporter permease [Chloroflexota bacterium]